MKTVKIPSDYNPYIVVVNGVTYAYKAGTTQEVPDEVAAVIENYNKLSPKGVPTDGGVLPFVTKADDGKLLGVDDGAWGKVNAPESGTEVVANPTLAGTEPALTGLQVGDDKYAVEAGISQADADARYLKLAGGTMTGSIIIDNSSAYIKSANSRDILRAGNSGDVYLGNTSSALQLHTSGQDVIHQRGSTQYCVLDEYNTSANPTLAGTEAALESLKIKGTSYKNQPSSMSYLTSAPSADNTDGIKIVVLSSEPATKYNGYLYIITA